MRINRIAFAGEKDAPAAPAKKQYANTQILPPLVELLTPHNSLDDVSVNNFADAWVKDPHGAIVTLATVVQKAQTALKDPAIHGTKPREDVAFVKGRLDRYLSFFRREFWEAKFPGRLIREFSPNLSRSEDTLQTALKIGIPPRKGVWRDFALFVQEKVPKEMRSALEALLPAEQKKVLQALPEKPFVSNHINDFPEPPAYEDKEGGGGLFGGNKDDFID